MISDNEKMIYILVDDIVKAKFFIAFSKCTQVVYLTNKVSCYFYLRFKTKSKVIFLKRRANETKKSIDVDRERLSKTIAVLNNRQSIECAVSNYKDMFNSLDYKLGTSIN